MTFYSSRNNLYSPGLSHGILTGRLRYCPSIIKHLGCFAWSTVWKYHFCDGRGSMGKLPNTMLQKYLILCRLESNVKSHIVCVCVCLICMHVWPRVCVCVYVAHVEAGGQLCRLESITYLYWALVIGSSLSRVCRKCLSPLSNHPSF